MEIPIWQYGCQMKTEPIVAGTIFVSTQNKTATETKCIHISDLAYQHFFFVYAELTLV